MEEYKKKQLEKWNQTKEQEKNTFLKLTNVKKEWFIGEWIFSFGQFNILTDQQLLPPEQQLFIIKLCILKDGTTKAFLSKSPGIMEGIWEFKFINFSYKKVQYQPQEEIMLFPFLKFSFHWLNETNTNEFMFEGYILKEDDVSFKFIQTQSPNISLISNSTENFLILTKEMESFI